MQTPFLGEIALFSFNFAPKGWALCAGQLLPINQNQALFSLLGTTYGGNGQTTFALPDLRSRVPVGVDPPALGETGGAEMVTLGTAAMPQHTHAVNTSGLTATARCKNGPGNQRTPVGNVPAVEAASVTATYSASPDANMNPAAIATGGTVTAATAGGGQSHENRQPYLVLSYCIALQGIFPSQN